MSNEGRDAQRRTPQVPAAGSQAARDPRLEIPDALRRPVDVPNARAELAQMRGASPTKSDTADAAVGWSIALNFVYGVIAGCLLGWAIQTWVFPQAAPWPLLGGVVVGLIVGFVRFIRDGLRANQS